MNNQMIEHNFKHHSPSDSKIKSHREVREAAKTLAFVINAMCPDCKETFTAIRKTEEAMFWANAAIARGQDVLAPNTSNKKTMQEQTAEWVEKNTCQWPIRKCWDKLEEEIAEVKEEINLLLKDSRWVGLRIGHPEGSVKRLGFEIADVIFALNCIAEQYHINVEQAFEEKMPKR